MRHMLVVISLFVHSSGSASVCIEKSPTEIARDAEVAFVGTVAKIEESAYKPWGACWDATLLKPKCGGKLVTFDVTEKLRGALEESVSVVSEDGCYCTGQYWSVDASYLVVAKENKSGLPGDFEAEDVCGGTGPIDLRENELNELRELSE